MVLITEKNARLNCGHWVAKIFGLRMSEQKAAAERLVACAEYLYEKRKLNMRSQNFKRSVLAKKEVSCQIPTSKQGESTGIKTLKTGASENLRATMQRQGRGGVPMTVNTTQAAVPPGGTSISPNTGRRKRARKGKKRKVVNRPSKR